MLNPGTMLIQFSGIPRLYGRVDIRDMAKGLAWASANINQLSQVLEQSGYFKERWSRSTITRFGPQKYGGLVPVNRKGFERGVGRALKAIVTGDLGSARRSFKSAAESIQFLDAIDRYIVGVAYGANLSKVKRERGDLSEDQQQALALQGAETDIRETQNSSSTIDFSVSASDWRRSAIGESFLLFSSDRFALINRLTEGQAQLRKGNKRDGARILAGSIVSQALEVPIRHSYWLMLGAAGAFFWGDEEDDRKKAERIEKEDKNLWGNVVRSVIGISPIFGGVFESVGSMFSEDLYADSFMSSAVGDSFTDMVRSVSRVENELMKLTDDEMDASYRIMIANTGRFVNQLVSLTTGNPFHPLVNKALRGWEGNINDPVGDLRKLDAHYDDVEDMTNEQREYANMIKRENKAIQSRMRSLRKELRLLEAREKAGENVDSEIEQNQNDMASEERKAMEVMGNK